MPDEKRKLHALRPWEEVAGWLFFPGTCYFVGLLGYQELALVCRFGPQIDYMWHQLAAGIKYGALSFVFSMLWLALTIIYLLFRRRSPLRRQWLLIVATSLTISIVFIPLSLWRLLIIYRCGAGHYEIDFLVEGAGEGNTAIVRYLLNKGANPNSTGSFSFPDTPLIAASRAGRTSIVQILIQHGAQPCLRDSDGHTPEQTARSNGHAQLAAYLARSYPCQ